MKVRFMAGGVEPIAMTVRGILIGRVQPMCYDES